MKFSAGILLNAACLALAGLIFLIATILAPRGPANSGERGASDSIRQPPGASAHDTEPHLLDRVPQSENADGQILSVEAHHENVAAHYGKLLDEYLSQHPEHIQAVHDYRFIRETSTFALQAVEQKLIRWVDNAAPAEREPRRSRMTALRQYSFLRSLEEILASDDPQLSARAASWISHKQQGQDSRDQRDLKERWASPFDSADIPSEEIRTFLASPETQLARLSGEIDRLGGGTDVLPMADEFQRASARNEPNGCHSVARAQSVSSRRGSAGPHGLREPVTLLLHASNASPPMKARARVIASLLAATLCIVGVKYLVAGKNADADKTGRGPIPASHTEPEVPEVPEGDWTAEKTLQTARDKIEAQSRKITELQTSIAQAEDQAANSSEDFRWLRETWDLYRGWWVINKPADESFRYTEQGILYQRLIWLQEYMSLMNNDRAGALVRDFLRGPSPGTVNSERADEFARSQWRSGQHPDARLPREVRDAFLDNPAAEIARLEAEIREKNIAPPDESVQDYLRDALRAQILTDAARERMNELLPTQTQEQIRQLRQASLEMGRLRAALNVFD